MKTRSCENQYLTVRVIKISLYLESARKLMAKNIPCHHFGHKTDYHLNIRFKFGNIVGVAAVV